MRRNTRMFLFILSIAALLLYYMAFIRQPDAGKKRITIEIQHLDGSSKTIETATEAATLRQLLESEDLVDGKDTEYGLLITMVDGVKADASIGESWVITKRGTPVTTSIDATPVEDGDAFVITHIIRD